MRLEYPAGAIRGEKMLELTGERYLPWIEDATIGYEHLHRYRFAREFVNGKTVLDLACGEGYGSYLLSEDARAVVGVDIDDLCIQHASRKYARENLKFLLGSMTEIPVPGRHVFDVVVCFEAIEHTDEQERLMAEVKRVLKDEGVFVVSTPNKAIYSDQEGARNPFHVKELYFDELKALLSSYFGNVVFYGQMVYPSSNLFLLPGGVKGPRPPMASRGRMASTFLSTAPGGLPGISSD